MRVRVRARGRSWGQKKTENRARRLGFGCALSNGDVGRWRGVLGWCGQGGGGGGGCAFECAPGGEAGAIKNENRARRLGFGCALSNGGVGGWGEVGGGGGRGGGGGGGWGQKKPKTELAGSVSGGPCQTAV